MAFKHTGRSVLSIPMGISIGIHALLVTGLIYLTWDKPTPKTEIPLIKISHISLEQKKKTSPQKTTKPAKGNLKPQNSSQLFKPAHHHASTVIRKNPLPVKPSIQTSDNISTNLQLQPTKTITNTVQRILPSSIQKARSQSTINKLGTPLTRTAVNLSTYTRHSFTSPTLHKEVTARTVTHELGKPLTRAVANISTYSKHSFSAPNRHKKLTARAITDELNSSPLKASPAPGLQIAERWIPVSKTHPVQIASIPTNFIDEYSESVSQASVAEKAGHPSGETDSSGQNLDAVRKGFSSSVWGKIAQAKYYPSLARKRGWEGKPIVEFKLARNGDLLSSAITLNSPYKILNEAALNAVKNAVPYPQIPERLKVDSIRFKLPISFILDEP
jgi:TonB family protein